MAERIYRVTGTAENGRVFRIMACCEWDWIARFSSLELDEAMFVDAPPGIPDTCDEHSYVLPGVRHGRD